MSVKSPHLARSTPEAKTPPRALLLSGPSAHPDQLSARLGARLRRVGWITREVRERPPRSSSAQSHETPLTSTHEYFWGDLTDPMTLVLATEDCQSAIIDLTRLPTRLWSPPEHEQETHLSSPRAPRVWRGSQAWTGKVILGALGRRGATYEVPTRHSTWREGDAPSSPLKQVSPLQDALSISPLSARAQARPLTFLAPTSMLGDLRLDLLSAEALNTYSRASWSPRVICFDWTLGDALSALDRPSDLGELDRFIAELLLKLLALKRRSPQLIAKLLRERITGLHEQPLAVIGVEDLVSATLLLHQRGQDLTSYWARGDRLTWGSLTQICLYLIDELDATAAQHAYISLTDKLQSDDGAHRWSWRRQLTRLLSSLSQYQRAPINAFLVEFKELASRLRGGGTSARVTAHLAPLPQHFNWTPAHTLLEDQVRRLLHKLERPAP